MGKDMNDPKCGMTHWCPIIKQVAQLQQQNKDFREMLRSIEIRKTLDDLDKIEIQILLDKYEEESND